MAYHTRPPASRLGERVAGPDIADCGSRCNCSSLLQDGANVACNLAVQLGEKMSVAVERHVDRRVAHTALDCLGMGALADRERDRVCLNRGTQPVQASGHPGGLPLTLVEDRPLRDCPAY